MLYTFVVTISSNFRQISYTSHRCIGVSVCDLCVRNFSSLQKNFFFLHLCASFYLFFSLLLSFANAASLSPLYLNVSVCVYALLIVVPFFHEINIHNHQTRFYIIIFNQSLKFMCKKLFVFHC